MMTPISTADPEEVKNQLFADYSDGHSARLHRVSLSMDAGAGTLVLDMPDGPRVIWPLSDIRELPDQASKAALVCFLQGEPAARLVVADVGAASELRGRCKNLHESAHRADTWRIAKWAAGAVASVALIILVLIPAMADQLAVLLPPEGERALGEATYDQISSALGQRSGGPLKTCNRPSGIAALAKMEAALSTELDLPYRVTLRVLDDEMVNAFALPGGYVALFRGLIDTADTPEEVAAVLAHEIGHVAARDPTRIALRSAGSIGVLGLLFGDFAGGFVVLGIANTLIEANYSQAAEVAADKFAHERLRAAGVRPDALADMFEKMKALGGDAQGISAYFSSHPATDERISSARAASAGLDEKSTPLLTRIEWFALKNICRQ